MSPRLWDAVMYAGEADMLEARLTELAPYAHRHVVVESLRDHRGNPRTLTLTEDQERFRPWLDRIIYVATTVTPDRPGPWSWEHAQRDAALTALRDAADDDVVLIADVDEFPPPGFLSPDPANWVRQRLGPDPAVGFLQRVAMYAVDWEYPSPQVCTVAARAGYVRERGLAAVRDARSRYPLISGGWHLTWLGGPTVQAAKIATHLHIAPGSAQAGMVASGACWRDGVHFTGEKLRPVEVDGTWPQWVYERRCPPSWFRPRT